MTVKRKRRSALDAAVGQRIRQLREALGLSQTEFLEGVPYSQTQLSKIELGARPPRLLVVRALAQRHRANEQWLLSGEGDMWATNAPPPTLRERVAHRASTDALRLAWLYDHSNVADRKFLDEAAARLHSAAQPPGDLEWTESLGDQAIVPVVGWVTSTGWRAERIPRSIQLSRRIAGDAVEAFEVRGAGALDPAVLIGDYLLCREGQPVAQDIVFAERLPRGPFVVRRWLPRAAETAVELQELGADRRSELVRSDEVAARRILTAVVRPCIVPRA